MKKLYKNKLVEQFEIGDIVSWDELNEKQKQYVVDNAFKWRELEHIWDWFNENIMEGYHYDIENLAEEYSTNYGIGINADKLYWQSNSQGPYPEWNLEQVFDTDYISIDEQGPEVSVEYYGRSTKVEYSALSVYYFDKEMDDWTSAYITLDELSNPEYGLSKELIDKVKSHMNAAQEFIDKVWETVNEVCTAYPDDSYIYDILDNTDTYFEIVSDTEAEPV